MGLWCLPPAWNVSGGLQSFPNDFLAVVVVVVVVVVYVFSFFLLPGQPKFRDA